MKTKLTKAHKSKSIRWSQSLQRLGEFCQQLPRILKQAKPNTEPIGASEKMPRVMILESELMAPCRRAAERGWEETGGHLFGAVSGDDLLVMISTPPGKGSIHSVTNFTQDLAYFQACEQYLSGHFGVKMVGREHSHHGLGLDTPSLGDHASATSIMKKKGMAAFIEIILTLDDRTGVVRVNAYVYLAKHGYKPVPVEVVILPGLSPMREAAFGSVVFPDAEMYAWRFPRERIAVERLAGEPASGIPRKLELQIGELPADVLEGVRVASEGEAISVELPLPGMVRGYVGYSTAVTDFPAAIYLRRSEADKPMDVTQRVNPAGKPVGLAAVYRRLVDIARFGLGRAESLETQSSHATKPSSGLPSSEPAVTPADAAVHKAAEEASRSRGAEIASQPRSRRGKNAANTNIQS